MAALCRAPSADVVDLPDGSNVDRRRPRSVHVGVGSERRCRRVLWKRFGGGTVLNPRQLRDEGMRFILPWNKLFLYDLRLQSATETYNAISRDGISLSASINIRYRLKRESIP